MKLINHHLFHKLLYAFCKKSMVVRYPQANYLLKSAIGLCIKGLKTFYLSKIKSLMDFGIGFGIRFDIEFAEPSETTYGKLVYLKGGVESLDTVNSKAAFKYCHSFNMY